MTGFNTVFSRVSDENSILGQRAVVYAPENAFPYMLSVTKPGPWSETLSQELQNLQSLEQGWDGYNSPPVDPVIGHSAYNILSQLERTIRENRVLSSDLNAPYLVPVSGGGLQAEWHFDNFFVEIFFDRDTDMEACFYTEGLGVEPIDESAELVSRGANVDVSKLINWFKRIEDAKLPVREAA